MIPVTIYLSLEDETECDVFYAVKLYRLPVVPRIGEEIDFEDDSEFVVYGVSHAVEYGGVKVYARGSAAGRDVAAVVRVHKGEGWDVIIPDTEAV